MALDNREIGRLAIMQRSATRYVERRLERLDLVDDFHYSVEVSQQIEIPAHGDKGKEIGRELLVPLGQFPKDRMPDLVVEGPDGSRLPLLSREDRGHLGATLLTNMWAGSFFAAVPKSERARAVHAYKTIFTLIGTVVTSSGETSEEAFDLLEQLLHAWTVPGRKPPSVQLAALALLCDERFWAEAYALARSRLLVARMPGAPGRRYTLIVHHTERFSYQAHGWMSIRGVLRRLLAALGMSATVIRREVANIGEAGSLWVVQSVPQGVEAVRYYWRSESRITKPSEPVSVETNRAVVSWHPPPGADGEADALRLEVQVAPSTALIAAIGLAALLLLVSTYVYQAIPEFGHSAAGHALLVSAVEEPGPVPEGFDEGDRSLLVGLGSLFAAIPAAIAAALAYGGQPFVRRMNRGPRALVTLMSVVAGFFAVVVSLKDFSSMAEGTAYVVSVYSFWVMGIFFFVQCGPRWRKGERSRWDWVTGNRSPSKCRTNQFRFAFGWLCFWSVVTVLFAHCQVALQQEHFFSADFPLNIWRALTSW